MLIIDKKHFILLFTSVVLGAVLMALIMINAWAVPFIAILVIVAAGFVLKYPKQAFILLLGLRILMDLLHILPSVGGISILEIFSGGSALFCIMLFFHRFHNDIERHPVIHLFFFWNIMLVYHLIFSPHTVTIATNYIKTFSPVLLLPVASSILISPGDGLKVLKWIALIGIAPILSSLYYLATGQMNDPDMVLNGIPRLLGGYKNLRHHGLVMLILSTLGYFQFFLTRNYKMKTFWTLYTIGAFTCLYFTMIRSSLLPFVLGVAFFCWITGRKQIVYLLAGIVFIALLFNDTLQERFNDLILVFTLSRESDIEELAKLGSGRYALWTSSFEAWMEKPILSQFLGLGFGAHKELTNTAFFAFDAASSKDLDPHNDLLFLLYDLGPMSLIVYILMVFISVNASWKLTKIGKTFEERQLGAICTTGLLALMMNNSLSNGTVKRVTIGWMFWLFGGIAFATLKSYYLQNRQEKQRNRISEKIHVIEPPLD